MKLNKKRGQITVYIIVGLLILIGLVAGAYYLVSQATPVIEPGTVTNLPGELQPVGKFVTDCLESTAEDALRVVMEHGGYADFTKLTANKYQPTEANSVEYSPDSNYLVPYWSYMKSRNTCTSGCEFSSMVKPLCRQGSSACVSQGANSVEEEIDWFIQQNIGKCLNSFIAFKAQQINVEQVGDIRPTTTIREGTVKVLLELPLRIGYQGTTKNIDKFTVDVDSSIADMYRVAVEILNYESEGCFLEDQETNVIAFYQGLDSDKLPPYSASTVGKNANTYWLLPNVEKDIKPVTSLAMQQIRVFNTATYPFSKVDAAGPNAKAMQAVYGQFVFQPLSEFHDVKVSFFYFPWWNPYLRIDPSKGSIIGPSWMLSASGGGWLSNIINKVLPKEYEYYYHMSFPAVVEIRKWDEKNLKEELLRFALEGNIRSNKCFSAGASIVTEAGGESLLCDPALREAKQYTVRVGDEATNLPVMGAEVFFYAGDSCSLGTTDSSGKLITALPAATGGFIDIKKEGYLEYYAHEQDFGMLGAIKLKPLVAKGITIKIFNETNMLKMAAMNEQAMINFRDAVSYSPDATHNLIITLTREKENYHEGLLEQTMSLMPDDSGNMVLTPDTVQLAPGKYTAEIMLIYTQPVTVAKEYDRVCAGCDKEPKMECSISPNWLPECDSCDWKDGSSCTKKCWQETDCYKWGFTCDPPFLGSCDADEELFYNVTQLKSVPNGGVTFDVNNGYWNVADYSALNDVLKPKVKFYIVQQRLPVRHYQLENLDAYRAYSKNYKYLFLPEFTNG